MSFFVYYTLLPTQEIVWRKANFVDGGDNKEFVDILYEKTIGEGIAKITKPTKAFCSGGDHAVSTQDGYADPNDVGHLNVLDLQVQIRRLPKSIIAIVAGYAAGVEYILHMVYDLTIVAFKLSKR